MNAFSDSAWRTIRADALDTEADAIDRAANTLAEVVPALDSIAAAIAQNTVNLLSDLSKRRKEGAAKLRVAA